MTKMESTYHCGGTYLSKEGQMRLVTSDISIEIRYSFIHVTLM